MKKKLTANLGLKILAVLFSVVIWFIVVNINDPVDKTVIRNVPVEILNADVVTTQGKVYEILEGTDVIDVTIWAKRSILDTLGKENIIATADMQEINLMDTMVRIKLSTNKYNDKLESISSSTENMLIRVEDLRRAQFVIETTTIGEPAEGYIYGNISSDQNLVNVSGPESVVSRIDRAEVAVNVSGLSQDIRTDETIRLYDADNNLVEDKNLKRSLDQVKVNIEILQTKRIPLVFTCTGIPAPGYALTGVIESSPSTVLVAGKGNAIKNISQIEIPDTELNVNGFSNDMVEVIELKRFLPDNVSLAESDFNGKVSVTVHIEKEISSAIRINADEIAITGLSADMAGEIVEPAGGIRLNVTGLSKNLEELENAQISASVDVAEYMAGNALTELPPGEYDMSLKLSLPDGIRQEEMLVRVLIGDAADEQEQDQDQGQEVEE